MSRLKVIASAYACEPNRGSEPGIGWNIVKQASRYHTIWVITRENNQPGIDEALVGDTESDLKMVYYDLPKWARWWKRGTRGLQLYYYLWQIGSYRLARRLHKTESFDVSHHITFGRYWNPSFLPKLPIPFVLGPVGGGESAPPAFKSGFGTRGRLYETARSLMRWIGEKDPLVRRTARRSRIALATTEETKARLVKLGAREVETLGNAALNETEIGRLSQLELAGAGKTVFVSAGRLLHWKGFHLGLQAFAASDPQDAEYRFVGSGPDRERLEALATELGISDKVSFLGQLPREKTLLEFQKAHALVHPSLHDSGGWVCIEAMAAATPVICLDLGGPAVMVDDSNGFKIHAEQPDKAVSGMVAAMKAIYTRSSDYEARCNKARLDAQHHFTWEAKGSRIAEVYETAAKDAHARRTTRKTTNHVALVMHHAG